MTEPGWETTTAWRELLDGLRDLDAHFLTGPKAVRGEAAVAEGYRFLSTVLAVAFDLYLFSDPGRPRFVDINTPFRPDRAWGGDNTDAYYAFAPVDPARRYRVSGNRGDSVYFSLTVYNEPAPGQWSDRVVGLLNDTDLTFDGDGSFSFDMGPGRPDGHVGPYLEIGPDGAAAVTRDYQLDPATGRRVDWTIEALDPPPVSPPTDRSTAVALRTALRWVQEMFAIVPLTVQERDDGTSLGHQGPGAANTCSDPYQVPDANYGWSARDACYSFGSFSLRPDEALVITHRPPPCRFWNLTLWNPYMAGVDERYGRTSINDGTAVPDADGAVTVVISRGAHEHPNAITTADHEEGIIAFRWFLAESVPEPPAVQLLALADAPTATR